MTKKKILFLANGPNIVASSRARVYNYRPFLEEQEFKVTIIAYNTFYNAKLNARNKKQGFMLKIINKFSQLLKIVFCLLVSFKYEVIVLQRVLLPNFLLNPIKLLYNRLIFDFDDAVYLADRWSNPFFGKDKFFKYFQNTLKIADHVIVSNYTLKETALKFNSKVSVLLTPVDTQRFAPKLKKDFKEVVVIGWMGSTEATKYLEPLKDAIELLTRMYPFLKVQFIGAESLKDWGANVMFEEWSLKNEIRDLQSFDIGIMPLNNDEWSSAKAGYKLLQYMAVGIPCVASPIGINKQIVDEGITGFFAKSPEEWVEKLSILIEDAGLRKVMGDEGRKKAEIFYSYHVNVPKLVKIIKSLGSS